MQYPALCAVSLEQAADLLEQATGRMESAFVEATDQRGVLRAIADMSALRMRIRELAITEREENGV